MPMPSKIARAAAISVPSSIRPVVSRVTCAWMGRACPVSANAAWMPWITALTSKMSCEVSISRRSTPPSIRPTACSRKTSTRSSNRMSDMVGSSAEMSLPLGPIEPATKRGFSGVLYASAKRRARAAAARLISKVRSARPYSARVSRLARKESVVSTSAPASRNPRWTFSTAWG